MQRYSAHRHGDGGRPAAGNNLDRKCSLPCSPSVARTEALQAIAYDNGKIYAFCAESGAQPGFSAPSGNAVSHRQP